ncbi:unnamed protein product, partial [Mesorhabditis spiculigera]
MQTSAILLLAACVACATAFAFNNEDRPQAFAYLGNDGGALRSSFAKRSEPQKFAFASPDQLQNAERFAFAFAKRDGDFNEYQRFARAQKFAKFA